MRDVLSVGWKNRLDSKFLDLTDYYPKVSPPLPQPELDKPVARFQGKEDNRINKLRYDNKTGLFYINETQYFEGIKPEVFEYQIGGYQVCEKWLKDRKERLLTLDEIQTYCRIVTSLQKTIAIQKAIDEVYEKAEQVIL